MLSRRKMLGGAGAITAAAAAATVSKVAMAALPEPVIQTKPDTMPPLVPNTGRPYNPVVTLNGWTLPWRQNGDWKEFHLLAEPVERDEIAVAAIAAEDIDVLDRDVELVAPGIGKHHAIVR